MCESRGGRREGRGRGERLESGGGWGQGCLASAVDSPDGLVAQPGFIISN